MKVLQINVNCGRLSTGRICTDLADVLYKNGCECKIGYGRGVVPKKYQKYAIRIGSDFDVNIHALQTRLFDNTGFCSKKATETFIEWVENYNPDIIHLHNIHGYYINIELLFNYLVQVNKPVVWTLHDCWAFTGHCAHFSYVNCSKWLSGCFACPQKKSYPSSLFVDSSKRNWLKKKCLFTSVKKMILVTPSKWLANQVEQSFLKKYPIKVIPNGLDLNLFKPRLSEFRKKYNIENKKIILGVASAWSSRKGLGDFVELSKILDDSYKVVLVGLSERQKRNIPANILTISRTNNVEELAEIYTAADVFFNPSREETMGLTTVEAMACGTPVVVSNCTAVPEVVDESCGLVCKNFDLYSIKKNIDSVLNGCFSPLNSCKKYEKEKQFEKILSVYRELVK